MGSGKGLAGRQPLKGGGEISAAIGVETVSAGSDGHGQSPGQVAGYRSREISSKTTVDDTDPQRCLLQTAGS